ncbi:MAG: replicative DNA helicase [Cycloclasticus sp. symbiont of Poecilosclerida sp. N]|nr:MAG: replicative DNA helicase [Cycloclasticus sp. symbiont of Poecilosclerida sp. N]
MAAEPPLDYDMLDEIERVRVPPHSLQAEQSVLGGLMLDNQRWDTVMDKVSGVDFYQTDHQLIFESIADLAQKNEPFDVVTISEVLGRKGALEKAGGLAYLGALAKDTPSAANITSYASIVRQRSVRRQLIRISNEIADSAFDTKGGDVNELLDDAESKVFKIAEQGAKDQKGFEPLRDLLSVAVDKITKLHASGNALTGVSTGFTDLDAMTSGLQPADLIIVAGRPSMGKTSFAMNLVVEVGMKTGMPIAVFSMEMPGDSLALRMLSSLSHIDQHNVRTGQLEDDEWPRMQSSINILSEKTKIFIDDTAALSPSEVRARSRRLVKDHGPLSLIVLDYLQLMQSPSKSEGRVAEVSDISRSLKALAKELNVPVVALSQLNRNLEQRPNKRPVMSDLRESGSIEQDADVILFIYRDEVYNEESDAKGVAEIIIGKQRNGPIGTCTLTFLAEYTRFENYAKDAYMDDDY